MPHFAILSDGHKGVPRKTVSSARAERRGNEQKICAVRQLCGGSLWIVAIPLRNSLLLIWLRRAPATKCLEFNLDGPIMVLEEVEAVLNLAQQDF